MVNTDDQYQHQTWTTEVEKFCLPKNTMDDYGYTLYGGIFFQYMIKFTLSSLPTKLWDAVSWHCAHVLIIIRNLCPDFYKCSCGYMSVCACLTLCVYMCASSQTIVYIGMSANEIETETIWMNKLHIILKINERYFNWIEFFCVCQRALAKQTRTNYVYTHQINTNEKFGNWMWWWWSRLHWFHL